MESEDLQRKVFRNLKSDNTHLFAQWGSRNIMLTVSEEVDNQIAAMPTRASLSIIKEPGTTTLVFRNDGVTPDYDRMLKMDHTGRSVSDQRGASLCGVGQIEALVAGRRSPGEIGTLTFKSVHNYAETVFRLVANGTSSTFTGSVELPIETNEEDCVEKRFEGMMNVDDKLLEEIEALISIKVYPYAKANPDFEYKISSGNGKEKTIKPESVIYDGVNSDKIKRFGKKHYPITYRGKTYDVTLECADVHSFIKPDGHTLSDKASLYDKFHNSSDDGNGVFVEVGGVMAIFGGPESWKLLGLKKHSTRTGQRLLLTIPSDGELKELIFKESPNKSKVGICLSDITVRSKDNVMVSIFKELLDDAKRFSNEAKGEKGKVKHTRCTEDRLYKLMSHYREEFDYLFKQISPEHLALLSNKTIKELLSIRNAQKNSAKKCRGQQVALARPSEQHSESETKA